MKFHRLLRESESLGNLPIGFSAHQVVQDFLLASGKAALASGGEAGQGTKNLAEQRPVTPGAASGRSKQCVVELFRGSGLVNAPGGAGLEADQDRLQPVFAAQQDDGVQAAELPDQGSDFFIPARKSDGVQEDNPACPLCIAGCFTRSCRCNSAADAAEDGFQGIAK